MSSSIENDFDPPAWATRDEVIKAARHYINYWRIEARERNAQWLRAIDDASKLRSAARLVFHNFDTFGQVDAQSMHELNLAIRGEKKR
jgi:hypothetical protein